VTRRSIKRRRALIGIGALAFGASGAVASGAIRVGSEGSLGDDWIQVSGASQAVSFNSPQPINVGDGAGSEETEDSEGVGGGSDDDSGGGGGSDDDSGGGGGSDDDSGGGGGSDDLLTSQLQVIVDPTRDNIVDPSGTPLTDEALIPWAGSIHETSLTRSTEDGRGLLLGIKSDKINTNAVTRYGTFSSTVPGDDVVFIIANGGSGESDISLPPVDILMRLYSSDSPEPIESDQIRFPYRVLDSDRSVTITGDDLSDLDVSVNLATGEVIEVIVEFDTTEGDGDFNINFSELRFLYNGVDD
jgi:hypothetical protein